MGLAGLLFLTPMSLIQAEEFPKVPGAAQKLGFSLITSGERTGQLEIPTFGPLRYLNPDIPYTKKKEGITSIEHSEDEIRHKISVHNSNGTASVYSINKGQDPKKARLLYSVYGTWEKAFSRKRGITKYEPSMLEKDTWDWQIRQGSDSERTSLVMSHDPSSGNFLVQYRKGEMPQYGDTIRMPKGFQFELLGNTAIRISRSDKKPFKRHGRMKTGKLSPYILIDARREFADVPWEGRFEIYLPGDEEPRGHTYNLGRYVMGLGK